MECGAGSRACDALSAGPNDGQLQGLAGTGRPLPAHPSQPAPLHTCTPQGQRVQGCHQPPPLHCLFRVRSQHIGEEAEWAVAGRRAAAADAPGEPSTERAAAAPRPPQLLSLPGPVLAEQDGQHFNIKWNHFPGQVRNSTAPALRFEQPRRLSRRGAAAAGGTGGGGFVGAWGTEEKGLREVHARAAARARTSGHSSRHFSRSYSAQRARRAARGPAAADGGVAPGAGRGRRRRGAELGARRVAGAVGAAGVRREPGHQHPVVLGAGGPHHCRRAAPGAAATRRAPGQHAACAGRTHQGRCLCDEGAGARGDAGGRARRPGVAI